MPVIQQPIQYAPPGKVSAFACVAVPAGWLFCDGSAVSRTTYAALFAAIGTAYGAGDGVNTFNLPNLQGEFIRGYDQTRGVDPGRWIGHAQGDAFQAHQHNYEDFANGAGGGYDGSGTARPMRTTSGIAQAEGYSVPRIADETRPRNVAQRLCIKT